MAFPGYPLIIKVGGMVAPLRSLTREQRLQVLPFFQPTGRGSYISELMSLLQRVSECYDHSLKWNQMDVALYGPP